MIVNDYEKIDLEMIGLFDQPIERITAAATSPFPTITTKNVALDILVFFYVSCALRQILLKYTFRANDHIIMMFSSNYSSYIYNFLNGFPFILICIQSEAVYKSQMATTAWLGSDMINISFIFGCIVYKYYTDQQVPMTYITARDMSFYIIGVIIVGILYNTNTYQQSICAILICYYFLSLSFQIFNKESKELIMLLLDIQEEEYIENAEQNFTYKKRRYSITDLKKYVNKSDPLLQKRLNIKNQFLKNATKSKVELIRNIYTILGAIKNKQNFMILQDARRYASRHPMAKVIQQQYEKENNFPVVENDDDEQQQLQQQDEMDKQHEEQIIKEQAEQQLLLDTNFFWEGETQFPDDLLGKIRYIILAPVNLALLIIPQYKNFNSNKLFFSIYTLYFLLQLLINYVLVALLHKICDDTKITTEAAGVLFLALSLQVPYIKHDLILAQNDKTIDFMSGYFQLGTFKLLGLGIGWAFKDDNYYSQSANQIKNSIGIISYIWAVFVLIIGINLTIIHQNKSKNYPIIYFAIYSIVILTSFLVMQIYK